MIHNIFIYFSPEVSEYCREFVCTVILGDDLITRQGMLIIDDLCNIFIYFSPDVSEYCQEFVCTVILGDEISSLGKAC